MVKRLFASVISSVLISSTFAATTAPHYIILPNIYLQHALSTNAQAAVATEQQAIDIVKRSLQIDAQSPYRAVRIRFVFDAQRQVKALIVGLLSNTTKSVKFVRIDVTPSWKVVKMTEDYQLQREDLLQSPNYAFKSTPHCPDPKVQFVIGNNFTDDVSVEKEVQKVFHLAQAKGYNPIMLTTNNPSAPQPTVQAYENWMSCPNVKGFYNESHGFNQGIVLSDDDFLYTLVDQDLLSKFNSEVVLFDSCVTFHDPLLPAMVNTNEGDAQQYIAGLIYLPFGASERTASCFWTNALNQQAMTHEMLRQCALDNDLEPEGFGIGGNGSKYLRTASTR